MARVRTMPYRSRPLGRLGVLLLGLSLATGAAADEFSSNGGRAPAPGGGPMYGNGRYGRDPECGGTDRAYYNQMYKSTAVVLSVQRSQEIYRATGGQAWYRCGACGSRVICWPRPGYEAMIAGTGASPAPGGGAPGSAAPAQTGFAGVPARFELSVDDDNPAATSLAQADAIAGDIIAGLRFLYGDARIDALSVPRSHQSNVETAALDYLNKVALGAVVARLTRGQVKNFIGRVGDEIMAKVFSNAQRQVRLADFPAGSSTSLRA